MFCVDCFANHQVEVATAQSLDTQFGVSSFDYIETHIHSVHHWVFMLDSPKLISRKLLPKDFLPCLPPMKKQKIMDIPFAMM